uniref:Adenylosuccinate synthetase n=1 Tax=candidate division WOR-3 bacterium TaxID=2052148 RepID=A0A7C6E969_UNCW3
MPVTAVVGTQWGDEGKGRIVDFLAQSADMVIRFQGGNNAGHTVINEYGKFALHLLPCGIFNPKAINIVGTGVVVNPEAIWQEIGKVQSAGIKIGDNLIISERAQVVMPYHILLDRLEEESLGEKRLGTTLRGIAPVYADKAARIGLQMADLLDREYLTERLNTILAKKNRIIKLIYNSEIVAVEEMVNYAYTYGQKLKPYIGDTLPIIQDALRKDKKILLEGQLGVMRDLDWGIYPYTTSSNPLPGFASVGAGIPPYAIKDVLGVVKAYSSSVGGGPFVTELKDATGDLIRERGKEYGAATGRPRRVGWFDAVATRYGVQLTGANRLALSLLDVLDVFAKIKICVAYKINGKEITTVPVTRLLNIAEPVYEEVDGWQRKTSEIRDFNDLPKPAINYIKRLEALLQVPIEIVSVGPKREQIISIRH